MKFGLSFNTAVHGTDPDSMVEAARRAEECGFESFCTSEHIVMYPGAMLPGYVPMPPDLAVADPLACLTYVAGATSSMLLGTVVQLLPYYQPILLAKQLATIDVLSRGRMSLLTIGLGVLSGEATQPVSILPLVAAEPMRRSTYSVCSGAAMQPASAIKASSSPCPRSAASPSHMKGARCRSTSPAQASPPPAVLAAAAMATSRAAGSPQNNEPSSSPWCKQRQPQPTATPAHSTTPAVARST